MRMQVLKLLAGILHLGNVDFRYNDMNAVSGIVDPASTLAVSELLSIDDVELTRVLQKRTNTIMNEVCT